MSLRQNLGADASVAQKFSYQSECHCAKTNDLRIDKICCLVTSQNVTAPKHCIVIRFARLCLVTSQNVTAPKPTEPPRRRSSCLVTSQNVTAPKPLSQNLPCKETSILTESEIISEQSSRSITCLFSLSLSRIDVSVSMRRACIPRKMT